MVASRTFGLRTVGAIMALLALLGSLGGARPAAAAQTLHLPYPFGTKVEIIQGYNGGTHNGVERYSLDLVRAEGGTSGSPAVAPASGTVAFAQPPAGDHGCIGVAMDDSGDFHYMLCHLLLDRAYAYGDRIQAGQVLGTVAPPGMAGNNGTSHIHLQLYTLPGQQRTPVPFAAPQGLALEGISMPADGSSNQWACSGAACKLISSNPATRPAGALTNAIPSPPAPPSLPASGSLAVGQTVLVQGTGDCLRVHAQPRMESAQTGCIADGTPVSLREGPVQADGHSWWNLTTLGWVVADYLKPAPAFSGAGQGAGQTAGLGLTPPPPPPPLIPPPAPPSTGAPAGTPPPAIADQASLRIGASARVAAAADCLKVHEAPSLAAPVTACLADGSPVMLKDGPRTADGHDWWQLDSGGWAAADYLQVTPDSSG